MDKNCGFKVLMATMGLQIGGAETHIIELCKGLKKMGVTVFVASNGGVYESELTQYGITHYKVPLHNKKMNNVFSAYATLKKIIIENDIKLVHAHARIPAFLCGILQKKLHFRFVTTAHFNFINIFPYNLLTNWGEKSLAVSHDIKDYLMKTYNMPGEDISLTINGIDTGRFSAEKDSSAFLSEMGLNADSLIILNVTRLDKEPSGVLFPLIESAEELYKNNKNLKMIIVGDGDNFASVKAAADEMNKKLAAKVIILTGARTDINAILPCADIFVGISRAALEAMAAKRPVILAGGYGYIGRFDKNTMKDAYETNFTCRHFSKADKNILARDIQNLLNESAETKKGLGEYGRQVVMQNYSVEKMCNDTLALYEKVRFSNRKNDVMLYGYYGSGNSGDDVLLKSIVEDLREAKPDINITVLSRKPLETSKAHNVNSLYLFNFFAVKKLLRDTNALISGGGTLLQDLTSTRSLLFYISVMKWANKAGAKIMLYANGIGPVRLEKNRERIKNALAKADCITLRDSQSLELLRSLNVPEDIPVTLAADVAFSLKKSDAVKTHDILTKLGLNGKKYFAVSLRKWKNLKPSFCEQIAHFCDYVYEKYGMTAVFLPMQPSYDTKISKKVIALMKTEGKFLNPPVTTEEILSVAQNAEFVLSMRLHTIIFAAKAAVPSISIIYDPKIKAMTDILRQKHSVEASGFETENLLKYADEVIRERLEISEKLKEKAREQESLAKLSLNCAVKLLEKKEF
ncbi:MAG: polysaccharide pyruvyl transferase CsaB [Clostridiales bacterium]|nr:polysaccharide pyruvyl transferase CsaB [Clostridiales bacterium]